MFKIQWECFSFHYLMKKSSILLIITNDRRDTISHKEFEFITSSWELFLGSNLQDNYSFLAYYLRQFSCIRHIFSNHPHRLTVNLTHTLGIIFVRGSLLSPTKKWKNIQGIEISFHETQQNLEHICSFWVRRRKGRKNNESK